MADDMRLRGGPGCLALIVGTLVLAGVIVLVVLVGAVVLGIVAALVVVGLVVWAVDRLLLAVSPKRRERRARQGAVFTWRTGPLSSGPIIDATAVETTEQDRGGSGGQPPGISGTG
jgi:hypothetical protein